MGSYMNKTKLIDLQGNVVIITADSTEFEASQIFWDQDRSWILPISQIPLDFPMDLILMILVLILIRISLIFVQEPIRVYKL